MRTEAPQRSDQGMRQLLNSEENEHRAPKAAKLHVQICCGDVLEVLRTLPSETVHCCITSPPYYGLRDYGVDGQIGLEETPEQYINKLVGVFREVKRVLRRDGTLWVNIGDSYAGSGKGRKGDGTHGVVSGLQGTNKGTTVGHLRTTQLFPGIKRKELIGIPWMLAFALRADGWYLRSENIWHKPNPMPESVKDRPTKAHEQIFLLSKSPKYYYDSKAIKEPAQHYGTSDRRNNKKNGATGLAPHRGFKSETPTPNLVATNAPSGQSRPSGSRALTSPSSRQSCLKPAFSLDRLKVASCLTRFQVRPQPASLPLRMGGLTLALNSTLNTLRFRESASSGSSE